MRTNLYVYIQRIIAHLLILFSSFFFIPKCLAVETWELMSPKPSLNTAIDIYFFNQDTGYILNDLELITTVDGGKTWNIKEKFPGASDFNFLNRKGGIVTNQGYVHITNDGGKNWEKYNLGFYDKYFAINVVSEDTIFVCGQYRMLKSFDGGENWMDFPLPENYRATTMFFQNSMTGHIGCENGKLLKTIDGGATWRITVSVNSFPSDYQYLMFLNDSVGFSSRENASLMKTTDAGETWKEIWITGNIKIGTVYFTNDSMGYCAGAWGAIFKTQNGGESWSWKGFTPQQNIIGPYINSLFFLNSNLGYAVGEGGQIFRTEDGGENWLAYSSFYGIVNNSIFTSDSNGYIFKDGNFNKTTDGGTTWDNVKKQEQDLSLGVFDVVNDNLIYAVATLHGPNFLMGIFKSLDAGKTWQKTHLESRLIEENIYSIQFLNEQIGYVSGGYNYEMLLKTTDSGISWQKLGNYSFLQMQFTSFNVGYGVHKSGIHNELYKTVDAGKTWKIIFDNHTRIETIDFVNDTIGYLIDSESSIYKTQNGGETWLKIGESIFVYNHVLKFSSSDIGYITGHSSHASYIFKTIDGGLNWNTLETPLLPKDTEFQSISFTKNHVYITGNNGIILKYSDTAGEIGTSKIITTKLKVIPNPVNDKFTVISSENMIKVQLYDAFGHLMIETNDNEDIDISNLSRGIYFLVIQTASGTLSKKILKGR